jgi:hypothetical protein
MSGCTDETTFRNRAISASVAGPGLRRAGQVIQVAPAAPTSSPSRPGGEATATRHPRSTWSAARSKTTLATPASVGCAT